MIITPIFIISVGFSKTRRVKRRQEWTLGNSILLLGPSSPRLPPLGLFVSKAQSDLLRQLIVAAGAELEGKTESGWLCGCCGQCPVAFQELRKYGRLSWDVAKSSPQLLSWLCALHRIARKLVRWQKRFPSCRPWEEPQTQTSVTPRREAEGPEYHLAAANGSEPIQATEARRTAGQKETGTANTQEKPFWGHWGGG